MRRTARIETEHGDDAATIARSVRPDNTAEMETRVEGTRVVTTIDRETTGGVHATVDDYVVNVRLATRLTANTEPTDHE